jgi:hypothetical protein
MKDMMDMDAREISDFFATTGLAARPKNFRTFVSMTDGDARDYQIMKLRTRATIDRKYAHPKESKLGRGLARLFSADTTLGEKR